jgi:hypothetical protein
VTGRIPKMIVVQAKNNSPIGSAVKKLRESGKIDAKASVVMILTGWI